MPQPFWEKAYKDLATPAIRGGVPSPEIREIAAQLSPAARVLDLGCGEGRNALFLAERGFNIVAVFSDAIPPPDDLKEFCLGLFREGEVFSMYADWKNHPAAELHHSGSASGQPFAYAPDQQAGGEEPPDKAG